MSILEAGLRKKMLQTKDERGIGSLPIIQDWHHWWAVWGPKIVDQEGKQGWILFIMDAHEKLLELLMLTSRLLRNKPEWNSEHWSQKEWENIEAMGMEALAWYEANMPSMDSVPEWAQFLLSAQHGTFATLFRVCRELRAQQRLGLNTFVLERNEDGISAQEVA